MSLFVRAVVGAFASVLFAFFSIFAFHEVAAAASSAVSGDLALTEAQTVIEAVTSHPDVQAKWRALRALDWEREASKGGWRPKLDVSAGVGREHIEGRGYDGSDLFYYTHNGTTLTLTQAIYDGGLTRSLFKKLTHAMRMRYFDLLYTMEQVALAALQSHSDVVRYRVLVLLADKNYRRHMAIMDKVVERTAAGVDSAVNLETTKGRLALANTNLITEQSNLHDSVTQYIRIVGKHPADDLADYDMDTSVPENPQDGVEEALRRNPQLFSYAENSKSMYYAVDENESRLRPRLDLRGSTNWDYDADGNAGRRNKYIIELVMRYNIYNGGTDRANVKRAYEQYRESLEVFNKIERDIIQATLVSYNDVRAIGAQIPSLMQHRKSANFTREAYIKQFEAGRRSMLDLLDSENEYFQADVAYINALFNLRTAKAGYMAATGTLLDYYGIVKDDIPAKEELGKLKTGERAQAGIDEPESTNIYRRSQIASEDKTETLGKPEPIGF